MIENIKFNKILPELSVTNLKESLKFYKTLGFEIGYERPEDKFAFILLSVLMKFNLCFKNLILQINGMLEN